MSGLTVFVNKLPESASNERLEEIFSEIGPLKQCFVVKEKGGDKCRGFGYVTFSMEEDAKRALKELCLYDGRKITVDVAKRKIIDKKGRAPKAPDTKTPTPVPTSPAPTPPAPSKEKKTIIPKNSLRKARLIIRNLSFKCSEEDLRQTFAKFGTVLEANIALKPDGKMRGFAFVQFKNQLQAGNALKAMNLKEIKGRQVAVDWAIAKDKFLASQPPSASGIKKEEKIESKKPTADAEEEEEEEEKEEEEEEKEKKKKQVAPQKKKATSKPTPPLPESPSEDESEEEEEAAAADDDEDDDDENDDDDDDDENDDDDEDESGDDDDNDDEESDLGSDDDDDDDDEDDEDDGDQPARKKKRHLPSDVNQGKTVFIRNLSFDTEEEGLEEALLRYGELNYIKIVVHPDTEHSKGCAFAQFKQKEAADRCMATSQDESETGGIRVDGRKLNIVAAVTREDATKLKNKKVKVESGTRNLYLAREGLIRAGTKAAEGVPEADMAKRQRFEELKRTKLRDISVFVSKTRLCVHNLPKSVDNKQLRKLCLDAAGGGKAVRITECRVMYDKKPEKGQISGRSLGYGFVAFQDHEHALQTLRHLNNNPQIYGSNKRPIVEFSLEDGRKLKMKEARQQQSKQRFRKEPGTGGRPQSVGGAGPQKGGAGPQKGGAGPQKDGAGPKGVMTGEEQAKTLPKNGAQGQKQAQGQNHGQRQAQGQNQGQRQGQAQAWGPKPGQRPSHDQMHGQKQVQGTVYSGFQTKPEVEHIELEDGKKRRKVLPLPSHRGAKIRLRDKGKPQPPQPKKARNHPSRRERQGGQTLEKPIQQRAQSSKASRRQVRNRDDVRFDSLVEQYKRKLMGGNKSTATKKSKWFSS